MRIKLTKHELNKSYTMGKVKVAVTVNGKHGQYQSHRWKSPKVATEILQNNLKKQGIPTDNIQFRNKESKETVQIDVIKKYIESQGK